MTNSTQLTGTALNVTRAAFLTMDSVLFFAFALPFFPLFIIDMTRRIRRLLLRSAIITSESKNEDVQQLKQAMETLSPATRSRATSVAPTPRPEQQVIPPTHVQSVGPTQDIKLQQNIAPAIHNLSDEEADAALQKLASAVMLQQEEWTPVQSSYVQFYYFFPYWQLLVPVYRRRRSRILKAVQYIGNALLMLVRVLGIGVFLAAEISERILVLSWKGVHVYNYYIYLTIISFYVFFFHHALGLISAVVVFAAKTIDNRLLKPYRRDLQYRNSKSFFGSFLRQTDTVVSSNELYKTKTDKILAYTGMGLNILLELYASLQFALAALTYTSAFVVAGGYWVSNAISPPTAPLTPANYLRHGAQVVVSILDIIMSGCTLRMYHVCIVGAYSALYLVYYGAMQISGALEKNLQPYSGLLDVDVPWHLVTHLVVTFGMAAAFVAVHVIVDLRLRLLRLVIFKRYEKAYRELKQVQFSDILEQKSRTNTSVPPSARGANKHQFSQSVSSTAAPTPRTLENENYRKTDSSVEDGTFDASRTRVSSAASTPGQLTPTSSPTIGSQLSDAKMFLNPK